MNTVIVICAKYLIIVPILITALMLLYEPRSKWKKNVVHTCGVLAIAYILAKVGSHFFVDPRPFVVGHFTPLIPHAPDNGFPSDHTLLASALAAIVMCYRTRLAYFLWGLTLLIGTARVLAGVHHLVDILGSVIIALIAALIVHIVEKGMKNDIIHS